MRKKCLIFFSRDYQANLFPRLRIDGYDLYHVTLNRTEKDKVEKLGGKVVGCLEDMYPDLQEATLTYPYLKFSWGNDRFLKNYNYSRRLLMQKKIVSFWRGILEEYKPIGVVNEPVAIEVSEIMYIECERLGIPYLALSSFMMQDTIFFQHSPLHGSYEGELDNVIPSTIDIAKAKKLVDSIKSGFFKPSYTKNLSSRFSVIQLLKNFKLMFLTALRRFKVRDKEILDLCYGEYMFQIRLNISHFFKSLLCSNMYNSLDDLPPDVKLVFFPLHLEPEASILYCAYLFSDQDAVIKYILKCLPENYVLVVKEHPNQPGALLDKRFWSIRRDHPNLFLIRGEISSSPLIQKCDLIITLGGSAGFEGLVLGKSVINFGKTYYDSYNGVINISSFEQLYLFFREKNLKKLTQDDLIYFVAKVFSKMKRGNPFVHSALYTEANLLDISLSILEELATREAMLKNN